MGDAGKLVRRRYFWPTRSGHNQRKAHPSGRLWGRVVQPRRQPSGRDDHPRGPCPLGLPRTSRGWPFGLASFFLGPTL